MPSAGEDTFAYFCCRAKVCRVAGRDPPVLTCSYGLWFIILPIIMITVSRPRAAQTFTHLRMVRGSVAKGTDKANSDVDVMIISDQLSYSEILAKIDN